MIRRRAVPPTHQQPRLLSACGSTPGTPISPQPIATNAKVLGRPAGTRVPVSDKEEGSRNDDEIPLNPRHTFKLARFCCQIHSTCCSTTTYRHDRTQNVPKDICRTTENISLLLAKDIAQSSRQKRHASLVVYLSSRQFADSDSPRRG